MTSCACPASSLTSVAFAHGVVMQRCRSHELQTWTLDGRATDARTVRRLLKDLFVETRGQRGAAVARSPRLPGTSTPSAPVPAGDVDEQLTALLNARGLQGSWAVA